MQDKEINSKLKACKTAEELKTVAKEIGYELTDEEAKNYFEKIQKSGELSDDELSNVTGGACAKWRRGKAYSSKPHHYLIVTAGNSCPGWQLPINGDPKVRHVCPNCGRYERYLDAFARYCNKRTFDNDPYNPK